MTTAKLRALQRNKGLSQQQMADLIGVSKRTYQRWVSTKNEEEPPPWAFKRLGE